MNGVTAEQLAQLREVAERANTPGSLTSYSKATALMEFDALITPDITLALLDELERVTDQRANWHQMAVKLGDEMDGAEKRIAELESKLANPVLLPKTNGYWTEQEKAYEEAITLAKRQVRLAGFRCEGDE